MIGVAGFAGGATLTAGCAAAAAAGCKLATCCLPSGTPGWAAMACCRAANEGGGAGGVFFATTCRLATAAGGAATCPAVEAFAPCTACRVGATATRPLTDADAISCAFTVTDTFATGCALANAFCGTAITAPCTPRFA